LAYFVHRQLRRRKIPFLGAPQINFDLEVEEPGKFKRSAYIDVLSRIEGVPVQPGLVVPATLTVAYPPAPTVTYKVTPPPAPEYKRIVPAPYVGTPPKKATRIFA
jgi:hypothetical protein